MMASFFSKSDDDFAAAIDAFMNANNNGVAEGHIVKNELPPAVVTLPSNSSNSTSEPRDKFCHSNVDIDEKGKEEEESSFVSSSCGPTTSCEKAAAPPLGQLTADDYSLLRALLLPPQQQQQAVAGGDEATPTVSHHAAHNSALNLLARGHQEEDERQLGGDIHIHAQKEKRAESVDDCEHLLTTTDGSAFRDLLIGGIDMEDEADRELMGLLTRKKNEERVGARGKEENGDRIKSSSNNNETNDASLGRNFFSNTMVGVGGTFLRGGQVEGSEENSRFSNFPPHKGNPQPVGGVRERDMLDVATGFKTTKSLFPNLTPDELRHLSEGQSLAVGSATHPSTFISGTNTANNNNNKSNTKVAMIRMSSILGDDVDDIETDNEGGDEEALFGEQVGGGANDNDKDAAVNNANINSKNTTNDGDCERIHVRCNTNNTTEDPLTLLSVDKEEQSRKRSSIARLAKAAASSHVDPDTAVLLAGLEDATFWRETSTKRRGRTHGDYEKERRGQEDNLVGEAAVKVEEALPPTPSLNTFFVAGDVSNTKKTQTTTKERNEKKNLSGTCSRLLRNKAVEEQSRGGGLNDRNGAGEEKKEEEEESKRGLDLAFEKGDAFSCDASDAALEGDDNNDDIDDDDDALAKLLTTTANARSRGRSQPIAQRRVSSSSSSPSSLTFARQSELEGDEKGAKEEQQPHSKSREESEHEENKEDKKEDENDTLDSLSSSSLRSRSSSSSSSSSSSLDLPISEETAIAMPHADDHERIIACKTEKDEQRPPWITNVKPNEDDANGITCCSKSPQGDSTVAGSNGRGGGGGGTSETKTRDFREALAEIISEKTAADDAASAAIMVRIGEEAEGPPVYGDKNDDHDNNNNSFDAVVPMVLDPTFDYDANINGISSRFGELKTSMMNMNMMMTTTAMARRTSDDTPFGTTNNTIMSPSPNAATATITSAVAATGIFSAVAAVTSSATTRTSNDDPSDFTQPPTQRTRRAEQIKCLECPRHNKEEEIRNDGDDDDVVEDSYLRNIIGIVDKENVDDQHLVRLLLAAGGVTGAAGEKADDLQ